MWWRSLTVEVVARAARGGVFLGCLLLIACGDGGGDTTSEIGDASSASDTGRPTSSGDVGGGTHTDGPGDGADDDAASGGQQPDLGPCAQYIECVMEAMPVAITTAIATYGEEGTCWSLPGVTAENCWTECVAQQQAVREAYPEAAACWECQSDDDCQVDLPYCGFDHVCTGDMVSCDVRSASERYCLHGVADAIQGCPSVLLPGRCSAKGSIGVCSVTQSGYEAVWYEEATPGEAEAICNGLWDGSWMPT
jgi:hypothetical protein